MRRSRKNRNNQDLSSDPVHVGITLPSSPCLRLMESLKIIQQAQEIIDYHLPENLKKQCRVGSIKHGTLSIVTPNATWAMHLKSICGDLRYALQMHDAFSHVRQVTVKVKPRQLAKKTKRCLPTARPPTPEIAQMIASVASNIKNPTLKAALQRLARHRR